MLEAKLFYHNGSIIQLVPIRKGDLEYVSKKFPYVELDENFIKEVEAKDENEIVCYLIGDIEYVLEDKEPNEAAMVGFITNPENHGLKDIIHSKFKFGEALELLKLGFKVARVGWSGKNMWLVFVPGTEVEVREGTPYWNAGLRGKIKIDGHIDMYTAQGTMQPGWLASQADMQAEDWVVINLFKVKKDEK